MKAYRPILPEKTRKVKIKDAKGNARELYNTKTRQI